MKRLLIYIIGAGLLACPALTSTAQDNYDFEAARQLEVFNTAYRQLHLHYVDSLDAKKRLGEALDYMLGQIDPYTEYYRKEDTENLKALSTGKYAGIGSPIVYRKDLDCAVFSNPYHDKPAYRSGVRSGDRIKRIDGKAVSGEHPADTQDYLTNITNMLRGEPGTTVTVDLERPCYPISSDETVEDTVRKLTLTITREQIHQNNVELAKMLDETVGYVSLSGYTEGASDELKTAVQGLKSSGMKSFILDLRGNGGGLLEEAVKMVSLFVKRGSDVVTMRGRSSSEGTTYRTPSEPLDRKLPIVVLTDYGTASAAEITCGALQDMDRAVIVGARTYGKGLVQQSCALPLDGAMKYTVAKYYIPSGRCIQALDYAHRGDDGQPLHLPDSLCKTFYTAGGRPVRDGGGITPDHTIVPDTLPSLIAYLRLSTQLFDWGVAYHNSHERIASPTEFRISPDEMADFKAFLKQRGFKYDNQSKQKLKELRSWAHLEGYDTDSSELFDRLEAALSHDIDHDFIRWEQEIRKVAEAEVVSCYYDYRGETEYFLRDDPVLQAALDILHSPDRYDAFLRK